jgi:hypothetical protein
MLTKTIKIATSSQTTPQTKDPRRTFETAMARLEHGKAPLKPSQTPICVRPRKGEQPVTDKQILADAARALAQLWKVSPVLVRREATSPATA